MWNPCGIISWMLCIGVTVVFVLLMVNLNKPIEGRGKDENGNTFWDKFDDLPRVIPNAGDVVAITGSVDIERDASFRRFLEVHLKLSNQSCLFPNLVLKSQRPPDELKTDFIKSASCLSTSSRCILNFTDGGDLDREDIGNDEKIVFRNPGLCDYEIIYMKFSYGQFNFIETLDTLLFNMLYSFGWVISLIILCVCYACWRDKCDCRNKNNTNNNTIHEYNPHTSVSDDHHPVVYVPMTESEVGVNGDY